MKLLRSFGYQRAEVKFTTKMKYYPIASRSQSNTTTDLKQLFMTAACLLVEKIVIYNLFDWNLLTKFFCIIYLRYRKSSLNWAFLWAVCGEDILQDMIQQINFDKRCVFGTVRFRFFGCDKVVCKLFSLPEASPGGRRTLNKTNKPKIFACMGHCQLPSPLPFDIFLISSFWFNRLPLQTPSFSSNLIF